VRAAHDAMNDRWRAAGLHRGVTLGELLLTGCDEHGGCEITFVSQTRPERATLARIGREAAARAAALHALGLRAGDVIAVQLPNWLETAVIYHAAARLGLVLVPIVPIYGPAEVTFILRDSGARAFVTAARHRRQDAARDLPGWREVGTLEHVIVVGGPAPGGALGWDDLEGGSGFPAPTGRSPDLALIIYTSGTTAEPKGVQHSHDSLIAEMACSPTPPPGIPGTVSLQPFPAGHTAGLVALLATAVHGYDTIMMDAWDADVAAALIAERGVTAMAGTPIFISTMLDAAERGGHDIGTLRHGITGGAGVPPSLVERADAVGMHVARCYGATECPSLTGSASADPLDRRARTDGSPLGGMEVRILGPDGEDVAPGEEGEVAAIGPELFIAYTDPALNEAAFTPDGWFLTGDIGRFDAAGCLTITDRKKDIIIRGGENISSKEVEDVLARHPAVAECAVVAAPDERYGERVCAFVVLTAGAELSVEELAQHFEAEGVARHKAPERLEIVTDLPRTAAGKVRKPDLRRLLSV
jgi:acyl-CoA synthetase (AMP-forming)/AMP-acid ligase II